MTGIGGGGHGEQIVKALRLGRRRYEIIGVDMRPESFGRLLTDQFHVLPPARDPDYIGCLLDLARETGAVALFHGSEAEMVAMSHARERLEAAGLYVPVNRPELLRICQDKVATMSFLKERGFAVPRWHEISDIEGVEEVDWLPVVLKPSVEGGGSVNTFIAQTRNELITFANLLLASYPKFLAQEYVGTPDHEYTIGVLFGRDGALLNSIAIRRFLTSALSLRLSVPNRTGVPSLGPRLVLSSGISQGRIENRPDLLRQAEDMAISLSPTAPVNIQCRLVEDRLIPFEINPRFSGTTSLRAMAGYNEPDTLIRRDVYGEPIAPGFDYRFITVLRGLAEHAFD